MTADQIVEAVRDCVRGKEPQNDISDILRTHKCYALIKQGNTAQEMMERVVNLAAIKERYRVCEPFFKNVSFPYAVIKGAVLSSVVCQDPYRRVSGDIDILINRRDADKAKTLLKNLGFVQGRITENGIVPFSRKEILYQTSMSHQTAPYIKETANKFCPYVNVDINMDILWGECEYRSDMDTVLSYTEKCSLFDMEFYKLTPEMEFVALCLHHYKDMNSLYLLSQGSLSLGLLCDIYFYLKNACPSVNKICEISRKFNVSRYVYVCLSHTMEIFSDTLLIPYIDSLKKDCDEKLLNSFGLNDIERKIWDIPLKDRLFHPNLRQYMRKFLTDVDLEKIRINHENMESTRLKIFTKNVAKS